jgi:hypothetical protein
MTDMYTISPYVLEHPDSRIMCLPADDVGGNTRGLAVFAKFAYTEFSEVRCAMVACLC